MRHLQRTAAEGVGRLEVFWGEVEDGDSWRDGQRDRRTMGMYNMEEFYWMTEGRTRGWAQNGDKCNMEKGFHSFWCTLCAPLSLAGATQVPLPSALASSHGKQLKYISGAGLPPKVGSFYPAKPSFALPISNVLVCAFQSLFVSPARGHESLRCCLD